jgi:hypothetical protein
MTICPRHGTPMTTQHTGPEDLEICKKCYDETLLYRKTRRFEDPADEIMRQYETAKTK